jgi:hypothetical protein
MLFDDIHVNTRPRRRGGGGNTKAARDLAITERKLENARRGASGLRQLADTLTYVGAFAPLAGAMVAPTVLPMLPGPTEAQLVEMAAKKQSPLRSKRVLIPAAATGGVVVFGGRSIWARAGAAVLGGITAAAYTGTRAKMAAGNLNLLAVGEG